MDLKPAEIVEPGERERNRRKEFNKLRDQGFDLTEAAVGSGYSPKSIGFLSGVDKKRRGKQLETLRPLAVRALEATLKGERIGMAEPPKMSDVFKAAQHVFLYTDPIVKVSQNVNIGITFTEVDLSRYENRGLIELTSGPIKVGLTKAKVNPEIHEETVIVGQSDGDGPEGGD